MKKILFLTLSLLLCNCSSDTNDDETNNTLPSLTTNSITNISSSWAISGGNITDNGGLDISIRGVCWDLNTAPTTDNNMLVNGSGIGSYTVEIPNLESNTNYHVRAFATNSLGTSYGNEVVFKTLKAITYEVLFFEFTSDTGNNSSRLRYDIKFNNLNDISVNGFPKITLNIDGLVSSNIASSASPCYSIAENSSCIISFDEEDSFDIGMINSIELVSVDYNFEN